jgi:DNA-binding HxlR family transcriptional regulator
MASDSKRICLCPLEGIINTIAKKWAILMITIIGNHEKIRFKDMMGCLDGISPKTLADLLKDLQREGLIHRHSFPEIPPRVEYSLTDDGRQLCEAIVPLVHWAEKRDNLHQKRCDATSCQSTSCPSKRTARQRKRRIIRG